MVVLETPVCYFCGKSGELNVPEEGILLYNMGYPIQKAFPDLTVDEREQIISGTHVGYCSNQWDEEFSEDF